jgi:hypothetical protein
MVKLSMKFEKDMGIEEIKVVKGFLSQEEIDFYINYIDNNNHIFRTDGIHGDKRKVIMFGNDMHHREKSEMTLSKVKDIEDKIRNELFVRVETKAKEIYQNRKDLLVCSFFIAKQSAGGKVEEHVDTDGGINMQFKYGGVIYLNKMDEGGKLKFPELNYEYSPEPGDLVLFPSRPYQYRHVVEEIYQDRYSLPVWLTEYPLWKL